MLESYQLDPSRSRHVYGAAVRLASFTAATAATAVIYGLAFALSTLWACGQADSGPLAVSLVPPLSAQVGREVSVPLVAAVDKDAQVLWSWDTPDLPDLPKRLRRPTLTTYTLGRAIWRFTPLAEDFGEHEVVFTATTDENQGEARLTLVIGAGSAPPIFREPVGEGTTLDLRTSSCATIAVVVESSADRDVVLSIVEAPEGAQLIQTESLAGQLVFCPTDLQIATESIYPLLLSAQSPTQTVTKSYVIVLRKPV